MLKTSAVLNITESNVSTVVKRTRLVRCIRILISILNDSLIHSMVKLGLPLPMFASHTGAAEMNSKSLQKPIRNTAIPHAILYGNFFFFFLHKMYII